MKHECPVWLGKKVNCRGPRMLNLKKQNKLIDRSDQWKPRQSNRFALGKTSKWNLNGNVVFTLCSELYTLKLGNCEKIDESIVQVVVTLKTEVTALKTGTNASIISKYWQIWCCRWDIGGWSKWQNLRIWKRKPTSGEFAASSFQLWNCGVGKNNYGSYQLQNCLGDDEPPHQRILKIHHDCLWWYIYHKISSKADLNFQGQWIQMFRDLLHEVAKVQEAFILWDKPRVRFRIVYPAQQPKEALAWDWGRQNEMLM